MMQSDEKQGRALPLGLQFIFTSLACSRFARALQGHVCVEGAIMVDLYTRDPGRIQSGEKRTYVHTALQLPRGELLDAEGVRSLTSLCHDFGMDPDQTEICRSPGSPSPDAGFARKLHRIVDLCGWSGGAPDARKIVTATMDWEAARRDFERHGGMGRDAERMLDAYIEELVLERCRTPGEVLESVARSWLETSPETGATRAASRREISERYAHAFADEAETALKARFGQRIAVGIVDSDEMADTEGVEIPCFHALVRVGELYYDAEATGGVADPWNIPALCRARQSSLRSEPRKETGAAADPSPG